MGSAKRAIGPKKNRSLGLRRLGQLIRLVAKLRSASGCPWDRKQTHRSLIPYLREEARELEQALKSGRWHRIEDELGDLLLQILLHAQIEAERGSFTMQDVAKSQYLKLRRRHPHVFGHKRLKTAGDVLLNWDKVKERERRHWKTDVRRRNLR